jgi:hypothetical protein
VGPSDETPVEGISSQDSRYAPLAIHLQSLPRRQEKVEVTFDDIERIIGDELPPSARQLHTWWANDAKSHLQSQEWLNVGWRVATLNMTEERGTFARIEERQRAYIDFYSSLLAVLRDMATFSIWNINPDGANWIGIGRLRQGGNQIAGFNFAFTRTRQFRVELYIDLGYVVPTYSIRAVVSRHPLLRRPCSARILRFIPYDRVHELSSAGEAVQSH